MPTSEQPSLFNEQAPSTDSVDAEQVAARIAETAPRVEYPDRTSEAAKDQGWGPVDDLPVEERPRGSHADGSKRVVEIPNRVRRNSPSLLSPAQARKGMSEEAIEAHHAINSAGAVAARAALGKPRTE